jgi:hypothetical protein
MEELETGTPDPCHPLIVLGGKALRGSNTLNAYVTGQRPASNGV